MYLVQHASFISYGLSTGLINLQMSPLACHFHTPGTSLRFRSYDDPDAQGEYSQISLWQIAGSPMGHHLGYMSQVTQSQRRRGLIQAQAWTGRVYYDILLRNTTFQIQKNMQSCNVKKSCMKKYNTKIYYNISVL